MIPLPQAQKLAARIAEELTPFCARLEIAGSIRRQRPYVNDVDLVILPLDRVISDAFRSRLFSRTSLVVDGPTNLIVRLQNGVQLDIFIARHESRDLLNTTPSNFGSLFLLRTGSKEHNIYIIERAKELGLTWKTHEGIIGPDGTILAAATEREIFQALKLHWLPPESRER